MIKSHVFAGALFIIVNIICFAFFIIFHKIKMSFFTSIALLLLIVATISSFKVFNNKPYSFKIFNKTPLVANGKRFEADPGSSLMAV